MYRIQREHFFFKLVFDIVAIEFSILGIHSLKIFYSARRRFTEKVPPRRVVYGCLIGNYEGAGVAKNEWPDTRSVPTRLLGRRALYICSLWRANWFYELYHSCSTFTKARLL